MESSPLKLLLFTASLVLLSACSDKSHAEPDKNTAIEAELKASKNETAEADCHCVPQVPGPLTPQLEAKAMKNASNLTNEERLLVLIRATDWVDICFLDANIKCTASKLKSGANNAKSYMLIALHELQYNDDLDNGKIRSYRRLNEHRFGFPHLNRNFLSNEFIAINNELGIIDCLNKACAGSPYP